MGDRKHLCEVRGVRRKPKAQVLWDFIGSPLRLLFLPDELVRRLALTTKGEERLAATLPHVKGRLLDIGAGQNKLVQSWGNGVGVDVYDWGGGAIIVDDVSNLPFKSETFDTVSFLACLNHIPQRKEALGEAFRVLRPGGQVLVVMIGPLLGAIGHRFWWYGGKRHSLEEKEGEVGGLTTKTIWALCEQAGFAPSWHRRFVYGLNNLYRAEKPRT